VIIDILLLIILIICAVTDLWKKKIFNIVTFPAMAAGFILNGYFEGLDGVIFASKGFFIGVGVFFPLFFLRIMGAGDVKLMMAIGSLKGFAFTLNTALASFLIGAVIGIIYAIFKGHFIKLVKSLYFTFISIFYPQLKADFPKISECLWVPYGSAIAIGAICVYFRIKFFIWM
jgi:prepilin peptidase CpaA